MNKTATVVVSREGVQFGPHAWYSHERITGVPLAVLQDPNVKLSVAASNYWNWLAEALNGMAPKAEPQPIMAQLEISVDSTMIDKIRDSLTSDHRILFDIAAERVRQDEQWGGPEHDDTHSGDDWLTFIDAQKIKARNECLDDDHATVVDPEGYRARLVKIAALAIAALESHDCKHAPAAEDAEEIRSFGKDEFMDFLNEALPEQISVRHFSAEYWVGLGVGGQMGVGPADDAMRQTSAAVRRLNDEMPGVAEARVSMDYCDCSVKLEVSA